MDVQEALSKRVGDAIAWRATQTHPDTDESNRRSSDALAELAEYVTSLTPSDPRLADIAELELRDDAFTGKDDPVDALIAAYGSNRHLQAHPATFLGALAGIVHERARARRRAAAGAA